MASNEAVETRVDWRARLIRSKGQHLGSSSAGNNQLQTGRFIRTFVALCHVFGFSSVPAAPLFWCFPLGGLPGFKFLDANIFVVLVTQVYTSCTVAAAKSLRKFFLFCIFSSAF